MTALALASYVRNITRYIAPYVCGNPNVATTAAFCNHCAA